MAQSMAPNLGRRFCLAVVIVAAGVSAFGFWANRAFYHDDAFVSLRYVRHLLIGDGLVWNPGERVEGYTSFLYAALEAVLGRAHVDLIVASRAIGLVAFLVLALFTWARGPTAAGDRTVARHAAMIPFVLVVTSFPLIVWAIGGLEGPLFAMLTATGVWLCQEALGRGSAGRSLAASGSLLGLACATRMDGLLFVAVSIVFLALGSEESRGERLAIFTAAFLAVFLPYYLWRTAYYHSLVPNTFWVKAAAPSWMGLRSGVKYVLSFVTTAPYLLALAALAALGSMLRRSFDRAMLYVLSAIVLYLSYVAYVGGDHMPAFRLVLPVIPLAALLFGAALTRMDLRLQGLAGRLVVVLLVILAALQTLDPRVNPRQPDAAAFVGTIVGKHIDRVWPRGSLVALNTAGATPYYAKDLRFVDMLGLNDAHIARRAIRTIEAPWQRVSGHLKGDGAYVLRRRPDYIIVGPAEGVTIREPWFLSDLEISRDAGFPADYDLRQERIDVTDAPGFQQHRATRSGVLTFTYYERRDRGGHEGGAQQ